ncbi:hypothetical protein [Maize yellow stripe virus]|nr:hypothetical protein [Maize yellow stripe virus]
MDPRYSAIATLLSTATSDAVTRGESANLSRMTNENIKNIFKDLLSLAQVNDDQRKLIKEYVKAQLLAKLRITDLPAIDYGIVYNNVDLDFLSMANMKDPAQFTTDEVISIAVYQWTLTTPLTVPVNEVIAAFSYNVIETFEA